MKLFRNRSLWAQHRQGQQSAKELACLKRGGVQKRVTLLEKRKERIFFVVLFCDLEGLLQQFVAPAWKIMHWKSVPVFARVEILSEGAFLGSLKLQAAS